MYCRQPAVGLEIVEGMYLRVTTVIPKTMCNKTGTGIVARVRSAFHDCLMLHPQASWKNGDREAVPNNISRHRHWHSHCNLLGNHPFGPNIDLTIQPSSAHMPSSTSLQGHLQAVPGRWMYRMTPGSINAINLATRCCARNPDTNP